MFFVEPTLKPVSATKRSRTDWNYFPSQPAFSSLSILSRAIKKEKWLWFTRSTENIGLLAGGEKYFRVLSDIQRFTMFCYCFRIKNFYVVVAIPYSDRLIWIVFYLCSLRGGRGGILYRRRKTKKNCCKLWTSLANAIIIHRGRQFLQVGASVCLIFSWYGSIDKFVWKKQMFLLALQFLK